MFDFFKKLPTLRDIIELAGAFLFFGVVAALCGRHLFDLSQMPAAEEVARMAAIAFFIPSLTEEVIFRGLVIRRFTLRYAIASVILFVLWHPIEALTFLPNARAVFFDPVFLFLVALLGALCTSAYFRSKSIWPSVIIHWLVVVFWKRLGGAIF